MGFEEAAMGEAEDFSLNFIFKLAILSMLLVFECSDVANDLTVVCYTVEKLFIFIGLEPEFGLVTNDYALLKSLVRFFSDFILLIVASGVNYFYSLFRKAWPRLEIILKAPVYFPVNFFISPLASSISLFIFLSIIFSFFLCFVLGVTFEGMEELELECFF